MKENSLTAWYVRMVGAGWPQLLYALTSSNIKRFSKFYLPVLLPVPSDVITDVINIWSVFFENFVCL